MGVFGNQGQMCIAASRLYVHSKIYDKFVEAAVQFAQAIKTGDPADPNTQHGPQVIIFFSYYAAKKIQSSKHFLMYLEMCGTNDKKSIRFS